MNGITANRIQHIHSFDALRVAAAVVVLLENAPSVADGAVWLNLLRAADFALLGAKVGVELLIMVSAFLLTRDLLWQGDPWRLLSRRLIGLLPLLVIVAGVSAWLYPETRIVAALLWIYNFDTAFLGATDPLLPWWTVFVILHLMVLWCALAALGVSKRGFTHLCVGWIVAAPLLGIGLEVLDASAWMEWNYKSTITRGVGWCVGVLVAIHGVPALPKYSAKRAVAMWALASVLYVGVNQMGPGPVPWQLIQVMLTVTAYVVFVMCVNAPGSPSTVLNRLAGYTFSLYIVQAPVIWWFTDGESAVPSLGTYGVMIGCCLIAAIVAEHAVVRPMYRLKPQLSAAERSEQATAASGGGKAA